MVEHLHAATRHTARAAARLAGFALLALLGGCGGGGGGTTPPPIPLAANQVAMTVEQDPNVSAFMTANMPYVTVTVCEPGGSNCVAVDHVLVDSKSTGLRLFASALGALSLPTETTTLGSSSAMVGECATFVSSYMWGPVRYADVKLASEQASSIPIQVVADPAFPGAPSACSGTAPQSYTTEGGTTGLGAKGILGVDVFQSDRQAYYACTASSCQATPLVAPPAPVANVVANFAADHNGVVLTMPVVAASGQSNATGTLTFGVDTQSDNSSAGFSTIALDAYGEFTATMNGTAYPTSIVDSGSNFYSLNMPAGTPTLTPPPPATWKYINPATATSYPVTFASNTTTDRYTTSIELDPVDLQTVQNVMPNTGILVSGTTTQIVGLPYFYGRSVALTFNGGSSAAGTGPLLGVN